MLALGAENKDLFKKKNTASIASVPGLPHFGLQSAPVHQVTQEALM